MADQKSQDDELENGAAPSQPTERHMPRLERLDAVERELLAALARRGDDTSALALPGSPPEPAGQVEQNLVDQPAPPGAETDVLGLLRALAGREAGAPQELAAPPPVAMEQPPAEEPFVSPPADSGAGVPPVRQRPRRLGSRPVVLVAVFALSLAAVIGFTGMLWTWLSASSSVKTRQAKPETSIARRQSAEPQIAAAPAAPVVAPAPQGPPDFLAVQQAMNDCDSDAAKDLNSIYFLVIPIKPLQDTYEALAQSGDRFSSFALLPSKVTLDGLQNNSLALQAKRYVYSAIDAGTGKTQKFDAVDGLSRFVWHDNSTVFKFKVGFEAAGLGTGPQWSAEFPRERGACYWVSVLFKS